MVIDNVTRDLLLQALDMSWPLARRLGAAEKATARLRYDLESRCAEIFPDFYWSSSNAFDFDESIRVNFPQSKRWKDLNDELTPERDAALRKLGFSYLNQTRLGLCEASDAVYEAAAEGRRDVEGLVRVRAFECSAGCPGESPPGAR